MKKKPYFNVYIEVEGEGHTTNACLRVNDTYSLSYHFDLDLSKIDGHLGGHIDHSKTHKIKIVRVELVQ